MLYYGKEYNIHYRQTHPPAKDRTYFTYPPNFFFKIFFKIVRPPVCVTFKTIPNQNPPYILRGWGIPPLTKTSIYGKQTQKVGSLLLWTVMPQEPSKHKT